MGITIAKAPVQAQGIDMDSIPEIATALGALAEGEYVLTGETFPVDVQNVTKDGKVVKGEDGKVLTTDKGRAKANATAAKYTRVIESRYDVKVRSRTWQNLDGEWVFGLTVKSEGEDAAHDEDDQETPETETPETETPETT